jgi:DNA-binding NarL/FixJ family response regulator
MVEQNFIPSIILVDDHLIYRQSLKMMIKGENLATIIGEASNGCEFLEILALIKPDLVLMDIEMPEMNGFEATEKALQLIPNLKIIAFSMFEDKEYCDKMIRLGVKGYILKTNGINELENAIRTVMEGKEYFYLDIKQS